MLKTLHFCCTGSQNKLKKKIINTTYELGSSGAGLCCADPISVFKLKGQVNAKEGVNIYTAQSAFVRVLMKNHNISTYEKDSSSASLWGAGRRLRIRTNRTV